MKITITIDIEDESPKRPQVVANGALTFERQAILDVIAQAGGQATPQQVSDLLGGSGTEITPAAVQTTMSRMVTRGLLVRTSRGVYKVVE